MYSVYIVYIEWTMGYVVHSSSTEVCVDEPAFTRGVPVLLQAIHQEESGASPGEWRIRSVFGTLWAGCTTCKCLNCEMLGQPCQIARHCSVALFRGARVTKVTRTTMAWVSMHLNDGFQWDKTVRCGYPAGVIGSPHDVDQEQRPGEGVRGRTSLRCKT
eukprot:sb/3472976/